MSERHARLPVYFCDLDLVRRAESRRLRMAGHGVDCGSDSVLRDLVLVVESEPRCGSDQVDRLVRQCVPSSRTSDIESGAAAISENVPLGTKRIDSLGLCALLITLTATGGVFTVRNQRFLRYRSRLRLKRGLRAATDNFSPYWHVSEKQGVV
jgi:hypothetical protein